MDKQIPGDQLAAIKAAIFQGRKIEAIKLYRAATGTQFKDAKDAVEALETELRASSPASFTAAPSGKGCLGAVVAVCLLVIVVVLILFRQ